MTDPAPLREAIARVNTLLEVMDIRLPVAFSVQQQTETAADLRAILSALPPDAPEGSEWHRSDSHNQTMLYTLMEDGWRKGEPRLVNDVTVTVQRSNPSTTDIEPIARAIHGFLSREALPTDAVQPVGMFYQNVSGEWVESHADSEGLTPLYATAPTAGSDAELEADMERDLTQSDVEAIEHSLRTILAFDAVRNLRSVLSDTMVRQHNGYDWNADPDSMTLRQSEAVTQADRVNAPTAGSGWVMVPREPTEAMLSRGGQELAMTRQRAQTVEDDAKDAWQAMIGTGRYAYVTAALSKGPGA